MITRREFLNGVGTVTLLGAAGCAVGAPRGASEGVDWHRVREQFTFPRDIGYFNTGTIGACPRPVIEAVTRRMAEIEEQLPEWNYRASPDLFPLSGYSPFAEWRKKMAEFVGAGVEEIAFTQNATMGMNFVANGLELQPGDEVVTTDQEHPGGINPWLLRAKRYGIVVKQVPVGPPLNHPDEVVKSFSDGITDKTKVMMFSHLTSSRGLLLPARRLCALARERGILSVLDGAQVVGQLKVNVKDLGCDFYVSSPHKWLCAPKGCGFMYVRKDLIDRVWNTLASSGYDNKTIAAARFQRYGTGNIALYVGLMAAVDFQNAIGRDVIEARVRSLTKMLRDGLAKFPKVSLSSYTHPELVAGVTVFRIEGRKDTEIEDAMWARKLRLYAMGADKGIRCGTHIYCLEEEIERVLSVVGKLAG